MIIISDTMNARADKHSIITLNVPCWRHAMLARVPDVDEKIASPKTATARGDAFSTELGRRSRPDGQLY
jgi:hypothetical protein